MGGDEGISKDVCCLSFLEESVRLEVGAFYGCLLTVETLIGGFSSTFIYCWELSASLGWACYACATTLENMLMPPLPSAFIGILLACFFKGADELLIGFFSSAILLSLYSSCILTGCCSSFAFKIFIISCIFSLSLAS